MRTEKRSDFKNFNRASCANARVTLQTARPGIVIGKKGEDVEALRKELTQMMGIPVQINIEETGSLNLMPPRWSNIAGQLSVG